ncbi:MAG TPA: ATP-binding protein [Kofleriaceae bacterium]|nr:ATP-binding protein [Kofleriaceae bacterium]
MSPVPANPPFRVPPESTGDPAEFLDDAPVAIHRIDAAGTIVWANRAELDLLGYSADEYIGRPLAAFWVDHDALADLLDRLRRGETVRDHEVRLRARDGAIRHVLISEAMRPDGRGGGVSRGFVRDVTAQRRAERERTQLIEDLTRTIRLNDMFSGIVGHDLRGPLSTIVMAGQLLLGYVDQPKAVRTIERLLNSADRMQRMISQLLDFARARADGGIELDRRPIDLTDVARDVIEEVRLARPDWKIELVVHGDVRGDHDGNRLSQVFSNLIGNAVQHGSPDTPLTLLIDGRDRDAIRVEVRNRGTIPPEVLPILFSPFRGSQQKALRSQGLGLGLFITAHIVQAHGGSIAAESADGWTVFRFDLPRRAAGARTATFDAGTSAGGSGSIPVVRDAEPAPAPAGTAPDTEARTAREMTRKHEERFRILVESIKDYAIFMLDAQGNVATWNAGAQRIKGYAAHEIIGRHFSVFYSEDEARSGKCEYELRAAARDGRFEDEGWRLRRDGTRFWANVVITALRDPSGALIGYAKVTRDLTERRQLEEERVRVAHAEEAVRLRDEFLSLASHELRTPLTVLLLQLAAVRERITGDDRATLAKLERSDRAGQRLTELIDALLDVSRIATGRFSLHREQADLADIVATAVDRLREIAASAGCTLSVAVDHAIGAWDRSRIDQIVTNLVSNSIRYAAGSPIAVTVERRDHDAVIEVRDQGPGLPDGQIARMFERFERGTSMRHYAGLGLGLYVVRQITEAHGGQVTAENSAGGGACFTVRLPLDPTSHELVA